MAELNTKVASVSYCDVCDRNHTGLNFTRFSDDNDKWHTVCPTTETVISLFDDELLPLEPYCILNDDDHASDSELENELNRLAALGYRLVRIVPPTPGHDDGTERVRYILYRDPDKQRDAADQPAPADDHRTALPVQRRHPENLMRGNHTGNPQKATNHPTDPKPADPDKDDIPF